VNKAIGVMEEVEVEIGRKKEVSHFGVAHTQTCICVSKELLWTKSLASILPTHAHAQA
jgi:hypothetical protein